MPNPTNANDRRLGLTWAFSSAFGGALMAIPWKIANEAGRPENSALILLAVAALANSLLVVVQSIRHRTTTHREKHGVPQSTTNGTQHDLTAREPGLRISSTEIVVATLLAVFTLLGNLASARAIQDLSPALLNVLLRADVLFVAIFAWLLLGERVEKRFWLGALLAVVGLVVLQGPTEIEDPASFFASGTGLAIAAAACFSGLAVATRRFIHRIDPVAVNAIRLWIAVGFWFLIYGIPKVSEFPEEQVLYATLAGIAGPFLGRLALMISARHLEARVTTLATLTTPVLTLVMAFLILSDWPQSHELVGGAIMIAGISIPFLRIPQTSRPEPTT